VGAEGDSRNLGLKSLGGAATDGQALPADSPYTSLDQAKKVTKEALERLRGAVKAVADEHDRLEDELDKAYNPMWGPIFKEGNELSRFGEQVESYACLYTSRVSNFLAYSPLRYFRAPRDKLPHEM